MKKSLFFFGFLFVSLMSLFFTSCGDDDNDIKRYEVIYERLMPKAVIGTQVVLLGHHYLGCMSEKKEPTHGLHFRNQRFLDLHTKKDIITDCLSL